MKNMGSAAKGETSLEYSLEIYPKEEITLLLPINTCMLTI